MREKLSRAKQFLQPNYEWCGVLLSLNMDLNDGLFDGCNSFSELSGPFVLDDTSLSNDFIELQPAATSNNPTPLSEDDKNIIQNLLNGWNMAYLFQTCLGEYKFINIHSLCIILIFCATYLNLNIYSYFFPRMKLYLQLKCDLNTIF